MVEKIIRGSGFLGPDKGRLTLGYVDEDGMLIIEYKAGKKFYKRKGEEFVKTLSKKLRWNLKNCKPGTRSAKSEESNLLRAKIAEWIPELATRIQKRAEETP